VVKLVSVVSALVAVGAGVYMLTLQTAAQGTTIFEAMAHGIGAYFIAKGLFIGGSLWRQDEGTNRSGCSSISPLSNMSGRARALHARTIPGCRPHRTVSGPAPGCTTCT